MVRKRVPRQVAVGSWDDWRDRVMGEIQQDHLGDGSYLREIDADLISILWDVFVYCSPDRRYRRTEDWLRNTTDTMDRLADQFSRVAALLDETANTMAQATISGTLNDMPGGVPNVILLRRRFQGASQQIAICARRYGSLLKREPGLKSLQLVGALTHPQTAASLKGKLDRSNDLLAVLVGCGYRAHGVKKYVRLKRVSTEDQEQVTPNAINKKIKHVRTHYPDQFKRVSLQAMDAAVKYADTPPPVRLTDWFPSILPPPR